MPADGMCSSFGWAWSRAMLTLISWDIWVARAAVAIVFAVIFDQSSVLVFLLVGSALCAYVAIRSKFVGDR
jgi:hypothetical protein